MVHVLHKGPKKDIIVVAFDNTEDIEFESQKREKKSDSSKTNKSKLPETKNKSILQFSKQEM